VIIEVEIKKITVAEYLEMEFDENDTHLYELLDGELVKRKVPTRNISAYLSNCRSLFMPM